MGMKQHHYKRLVVKSSRILTFHFGAAHCTNLTCMPGAFHAIYISNLKNSIALRMENLSVNPTGDTVIELNSSRLLGTVLSAGSKIFRGVAQSMLRIECGRCHIKFTKNVRVPTISVATVGKGSSCPQPCPGWVMGFVQIR